MLRISDRSSFHRHRWSFLFRRKQPPALPVELWEQILDHVLYIPFLLDTTFLRPQDFYLFIESRLIEYQPHAGAYTQSENERRILRLVCRSWNAILSRKSMRWVDVYLPHNLSISKRTKRVHLLRSLDGKADTVTWENAYSASTIFYSGRGGDTEKDISALFEQAANLQAIRSFIYKGSGNSLPQFALQTLETSFRTLTSLILTCSELSGTLHLPNLAILYLGVRATSIDIKEWWFPSLQHIAFGVDSVAGMYQPQLQRPFIPGPIDKLQSLSLPYRYAYLDANDSFWTSHPSLQFLSISSPLFILRSDPPPDHPLSHIHFLQTIADLDVIKVTDRSLRIPNLQTISTLDKIDRVKHNIHPQEWLDLYQTCRQKGIRWFDANGEEIDLGRTSPKGWRVLFQK